MAKVHHNSVMEGVSTSTETTEKNIFEKEIIDLVKNYSEKIRSFPFFKDLEQKQLSFEDYSRFFSHKYSAVGYFTHYLARGAEIAQQQNLSHIYKSFQDNFNDESGIIDGKYNAEYEHETWRQRMLKNLDVKKIHDNSTEYAKMIDTLRNSSNIFFMSGYLIFIELFVAVEMKRLWNAMLRDLPNDLTLYDKSNIPMNPLEYIKNHAGHDGNHYNEILNSVFSDMRNEQDKKDCENGIKFAFEAREERYENLYKVTFESKS